MALTIYEDSGRVRGNPFASLGAVERATTDSTGAVLGLQQCPEAPGLAQLLPQALVSPIERDPLAMLLSLTLSGWEGWQAAGSHRNAVAVAVGCNSGSHLGVGKSWPARAVGQRLDHDTQCRL